MFGLASLVVACGPNVSVGPIGDGSKARDLLTTVVDEGPVRAQVFGDPYGLDPARQDSLVATAIGDGVQGLDVRFSADPEAYSQAEPSLVVILNPVADPPPSMACEAPEQIRTVPASEELQILTAFCRGETLINAARADGSTQGPTDQRFKRMLWQSGAVLFPDDYEDNYGIDLVPGINIGIGGSFGF